MGSMAVAALLCCAVGACGHEHDPFAGGCYVGDGKGAVRTGAATPDDEFRIVLVGHPRYLSQKGWKQIELTTHSAHYVSRNDWIDVIRIEDGTWALGAVHACR
jgi:hypothetical protein